MSKPNIIYQCGSCAHEGTYIFRRNGKISCAKCGARLEFTRESTAQAFDPIVIHVDSQGNKRFPASPDAPVPPGFEKRELRTVREVREFERTVNREERQRWDETKIREEMTFDPQRRERHRELRSEMQHMTPFGRAFAEYAMQQTNGKSRGNYDPQFRVDIFSTDASNREEYRDTKTSWRGRKG
jgi:hypothetical protein